MKSTEAFSCVSGEFCPLAGARGYSAGERCRRLAGKMVTGYEVSAPGDRALSECVWRGNSSQSYLLGQSASGDNWQDKSIKADSEQFHEYWFERRPGSRHQDAMFMSFCLEPKKAGEDVTAQEVLVDHMQRLLSKYGLVFYRYRMARFSALGLAVHQTGRAVVERVEDLPRVETWVQTYSETLRAHQG